MNTSSQQSQSLSPIEIQLASTLTPVKPSPVFIQSTRRKFDFASPTIVAQRITDSKFVFLLLAGCLGVALAIISGTRILFYLASRNK